MLENVIDTVENCRYCLMCRHVAPVGHITGQEALTPHGIALVIASQRRGLLAWDADTVDVVYSDPDGGNSRAHCVTDQPLPEAIAAVRARLVAQDLAPAAVYAVDEQLRQWHNPYAAERPTPGEGQGEWALFVGDAGPHLWPTAVEAARSLLQAVGVAPVLIGNGRSNGYAASSLGFPETARQLAQATLDELADSGARALLLLTPGDYFTFHQLYDERLGVALPADVQLVDVVGLLTEQLEAGNLSFRKAEEQAPYAYVDPTHAVRAPLARAVAARELVTAVMPTPPRELFWRRERAHPVGSTSLQFSKPELAAQLTHARLADARESGAELLISEDPGTLAELAKYAADYGLRVQGLYELLADHLAQ